MPDLSIIIPTFNESNNVNLLTSGIKKALQSTTLTYDIWFMDDSTDNTCVLLEKLSRDFPFIHYIHRTGVKSLSKAVEEGFQLSSGQYLIVMDADLQHPPEVILDIIRQLQAGYDIVIPSRFIQGGSDGGAPILRKLISLVARLIGRLSLKKVRHVRDCTSGFIGFDRRIIQNTKLDSISWKIVIEILVKGSYSSLIEIPYHFNKRSAGASKLNAKEQWRYLVHIFWLFIYTKTVNS